MSKRFRSRNYAKNKKTVKQEDNSCPSEEEISNQEQMQESNGKKNNRGRHQNSLSILTQRFVQLIKCQPGQVIDLNQAMTKLNVQKRRIYDITNVLQGIGYVTKYQKNKIKWTGSTEDPLMEQQICKLKKEINDLQQQSKEISKKIEQVNSEIKERFLDNQDQAIYNYITQEDCKVIASRIKKQKNEDMFIIQAPKGTELQIPCQSDISTSQYPHQLILNATNGGQIQVYLCKQDKIQLIQANEQ